jgi:DNA polymerase-1
MVVPPKDCLWVAADYGQLEARVYACATRDPNLCASIIAKEDIHGYWLDHILRVYPPYVDRLHAKVGDNRKVWRDMIKGDLVFASLYGSTPQNVSDRTGIPLEIATDILGVFWDRYRVAAEWLKQQRRQYRDTGTVRNLCGVERYGLAEGNLAINYPVQSTAARLVLDAQNELAALAREHNDPFLLPRINIHDDLCFAMPANDLDRVEMYVDGISEVLTRVRYSWMVVPLTVEWRVGANWADLSAFHEYTGDYVRS